MIYFAPSLPKHLIVVRDNDKWAVPMIGKAGWSQRRVVTLPTLTPITKPHQQRLLAEAHGVPYE